MNSEEIKKAFEQEMIHIGQIRSKYIVWTMRAGDEYDAECDSWRAIKCLMGYYNKTEEQVIEMLKASTFNSPVVMNDEIFWME